MPKRTDIETILIIGSGPIVIGQGCEFDYSGAQACKALRDEGFRIVLVNSNPATIMTDPAFADRTYMEPITPEAVRKILEVERDRGTPVDAVLPTLGGQTALNCACEMHDRGTFADFGVELIGADRGVIHRAEDRQAFQAVCESVGLRTPRNRAVESLDDAKAFLEEVGLPAIIRPAFTLGGWGGGIAYNQQEFNGLVTRGLRASMIGQVQVDKSLLGWKEYELEVVRDKADNVIIVCGIENIDAMGVHTGDSVTVAPILTLTDKEYQALRDASIDIMRAVGVETGGSNVQFAVNPDPEPGPDGVKPFEFVVVEMNPRVSRSSALASKATGFPIAKIAAKLAVGYTLDELRNDITGTTSACFEPSIDYVVTKMPRWTFEKFPEADETLTTQMKSVGEAMAIGRTFKESFQKVIRSMDVKRFGFGLDKNDKWLAASRAVESDRIKLGRAGAGRAAADGEARRTADGQPIEWPIDIDKLVRKLSVPSQGRLYYVRYALKMGWSVERIHEHTKIDPFFLDQLAQLVEFEDELCRHASLNDLPRETLFEAKRLGYSDAQLANLYLGSITSETILTVRRRRESLGITPVFKCVDTCAAEFEAITPYYYSTYQAGHRAIGDDGQSREILPEDEIGGDPSKQKVIILGGGPNRIGQGIEFDYCCVHAAFAARELGFESVMINSNPETVSTDYDTSDLLFFEPLTLEDVLNVVERLGASPDFRHLSQIPDGDFLEGFENLAPHDAEFLIGKHAQLLGLERGLVVDAAAVTGRDLRADILQEDDLVTTISITPSKNKSRVEKKPRPWSAYVSEVRDESAAARFRKRVDTFRSNDVGPIRGAIVQFGGQTPLNLAAGLAAAGVPLLGTSLDSIDLAEDRDRFDDLLERLNLKRPPGAIARSLDEARDKARDIGYPVLVRPSYVLGGRGMEICPDEKALVHYMTSALDISDLAGAPVLIDKFLAAAVEVDVDVVADYQSGVTARPRSGEAAEAPSDKVPADDALPPKPTNSAASPLDHSATSPALPHTALVCAVMEHIEHAGVHSGDSTCSVPPFALPPRTVERIRETARTLAGELKVCGLMNVQLAVKDDEIYVIEVNPRASRTVPYVGKAKGVSWASMAAKAMMGVPLKDQPDAREIPDRGTFAVKAPVFPFQKFFGTDFVLGPEMRSTGEVMGFDVSLPNAYLKALIAAGVTLPKEGGVFVSVRGEDKPEIIDAARALMAMGFTVYTTQGTGAELRRHGLRPEILQKIGTGARPNVVDLMADDKIQLVINTPTRTGWQTDEGRIRATAVRLGIPMLTTVPAANAAVRAVQALKAGDWDVRALQEFAGETRADPAATQGLPEVAPLS